MKLLIIGGSRGIGKALLERSLRRGFDVSVLARFPEKTSALLNDPPADGVAFTVLKLKFSDRRATRPHLLFLSATVLATSINSSKKWLSKNHSVFV